MAYTRTLAQLTGQVRLYTDTENAASPTDAQIEAGLNASVRSLYARLADGGADFLSSSVTLATVSGTAAYDLPSAFWQLKSVVWRRGTRDVIPLSRFEDRDRADLENRTWSQGGRYRLADVALGGVPRIEFQPAPDGAYAIRIGYIPDPPTLSAAAPMTFASGMDTWVALDASIHILAAEETDVSVWLALQERVWRDEIVPSLTQRDQARTISISDHDSDGG